MTEAQDNAKNAYRMAQYYSNKSNKRGFSTLQILKADSHNALKTTHH